MKVQAKQYETFGQDPVSDEVVGARLDARLTRRASFIVDHMSVKPEFGFPQIFDSDSDLEAAYLFFKNPAVTFDSLLEPHVTKTVERIQDEDVILSLEDTTEFKFNGNVKRKGLGRLNKNTQGFLTHAALAVQANSELKMPLGVLGMETYTRPDRPKGKRSTFQRRKEKKCESKRWGRMVNTVEKAVDGKTKVIHIMDREGDMYELLSTELKGRNFVVRACQNRCVSVDTPDEQSNQVSHLLDELKKQPVQYFRSAHLSYRPESKLPGKKKSHPPRSEREAILSVSAMTALIQRPDRGASHLPKEVVVNVVRVFEENPPENETAVEWVLLTSESINTIEEINAVVEYYLKRWIIEELFKAIKTGCSFEKRQLETYKALRNALAVTIPIAWHLLLMRALSRSDPEKPADEIFDPRTLLLLAIMAKRYPLPEKPTVRDAVHAIAGMGGWLKRNGPPGWLTLGRGYQKLLADVHIAQTLLQLDPIELQKARRCLVS